MKKLSIFLLFAMPALHACDQENKKPDYTGTFALLSIIPQYVGYKENDPFSTFAPLERHLGRKLEPNELLFSIDGRIDTYDKSEKKLDLPDCLQTAEKRTYINLGLPVYLPYKELSHLKNDDSVSLTIYNDKEKSVSENLQERAWGFVAKVTNDPSYNVISEPQKLTVTLKSASKNLQELIYGLLVKAKNSPNYSIADKQKLLKNQILDTNDPTKFTHGPKGFDFSILNNNNLNNNNLN